MKASTLTPFELFGKQVRYVVPMFQRPYVWGLEEQWGPLWDDVRTLAERILEASPAGFHQTPTPPHFLGAVVLEQQMRQTAYTEVRHIVDGQQRLTTLQLLLDATQWVVDKWGGLTDASALAMLVLNNMAVVKETDERFKVWPSRADQAAFRATMRNDLVVNGDLATSRISKAHRYFSEEITEWATTDHDEEGTRLRLSALSQALTHHLKLVVIDLEPGDNAQVIFETLNHRGTPLLAADLVKNFVFQAADSNNEDVNRLYDDLWAPFDREEWRRNVKQGRLYRPRIDVFLNYWLAMRRTREVPADRVFTDFRDFVTSEGAVHGVMEDLSANSRVFEQLDLWPWASVEGTFAYRALRVMEQYALGPLLLWLLGQPEERIPPAERARSLRAIESWLVRRMVCRMTQKQVNQLVIELLKGLKSKPDASPSQVVADFFAGHEAESRRWPSDAEFRKAIREQPLYTGITRARLRMILEAIEDAMRTPLSDEELCQRGKYTIEHVLPQGWREHWAETLPRGDAAMTSLQRDGLLHTFGNLTLVNSRLNPSLSNLPWTDGQAEARGLKRDGDYKGKHTILSEHLNLHLNKAIVSRWKDGWDEASISARAQELESRMLTIWPSSAAFQTEP